MPVQGSSTRVDHERKLLYLSSSKLLGWVFFWMHKERRKLQRECLVLSCQHCHICKKLYSGTHPSIGVSRLRNEAKAHYDAAWGLIRILRRAEVPLLLSN
eukprot:823893-Amphidinium_carterae.1